jgi:uncharacterized membrane protein
MAEVHLHRICTAPARGLPGSRATPWREVRVFDRLVLAMRDSMVVPVMVLCAGSVAMLGTRLALSRRLLFLFLAYNLVLALIPYVVSVLLRGLPASWRGGVVAAPLLLVWLVFLPNAPYLLTDLIHLQPRAPIPMWFDAAMAAMFAGAGLLAGAASMENVRRAVGFWPGLAVVAVVSPLTGLGIFMGRELRFNSWDLATHPLSVIHGTLIRFADPLGQPEPWLMTIVCAFVVLVAWAALAALRQPVDFMSMSSSSSDWVS